MVPLRGIVRSENEVVRFCGKLIMNGSQSEDFIYKKITNLPELCDNDIINMENIRSLLALRDDIENLEKTTMFTKQDIDIVLEYFSVT